MPENDVERFRHNNAEVLVSTTWDCNLRCSYCFIEKNRAVSNGMEMGPEAAKRVVDALDEGLYDVESICIHFYGGEPLVNLPAMEAIIDHAAKKDKGRFTFSITTNGVCASPEALDLLARGKFGITLSVDGPSGIHDECRPDAFGMPTHDRVMSFLGNVRDRYACTIQGSSVVRSGWSLRKAYDYLTGLDVDCIKAQLVRLEPGKNYALSEHEREEYKKDLEYVGGKIIEDIENGRPPRDARFSNRVMQLLMGEKREVYCALGDPNIGVTPDGKIYPCLLMSSFANPLGHIDDVPPKWREAGLRLRKKMEPGQECLDCDVYDLCGGGCPAIMKVCGADECDIIRANCKVAENIYEHFDSRKTRHKLLALAGVSGII